MSPPRSEVLAVGGDVVRLILFSKFLQGFDVPGLIAKAQELGLEGYDLCARPGYVVGPENLHDLPGAVATFRRAGLDVPLITAPTDLLSAEDPRAAAYLTAMRDAGVGLLKIGYFGFNRRLDYWAEVARIRAVLAGWADLAARTGGTVLYHTHSGDMGQNASALLHLIHGFGPAVAGYLAPGHLVFCGEPFPFAAAVVAGQLRAVALKDGHRGRGHFAPAGQGDVDWAAVFDTLVERGFDGPLSVHAEYETPARQQFASLLPAEVAFFREARDRAVARTQQGAGR